MIHVSYRHTAFVQLLYLLLVAIPIRRDAFAVRTIGTPLANRFVVFVIWPLRKTFRAGPEILALSASHPVRVAEYSVRSLRLSYVDVTFVASVARYFVRETEGGVGAIESSNSAERATEIFPARDFILPQIAQILRYADQRDMTLNTTVKAANNVNSI